MAVIAFSAVGASAKGDLAGYAATTHGQLLDDLRGLGHELVEPADPRATHFVSLDYNQGTLAAVRDRIPVAQRVLVVYEPRVVIPANYKRSIRRQYGSVIGMSPAATVPFLPWPQRDWRSQPATGAARVPGSAAIINANKLSSVRGSLYGLRRRVIEQFYAENQPLTLAGGGWARAGRALLIENARAIAYALVNRERLDLREWARPLPLTGSVDYVGRIDDKDDILTASEFAVVIENSATYVSEKLFDAIIAGCVPLYVGPALAEYGIPDDVVVALPQEAAAFTAAVRDLTVGAKNSVLQAGRDWLDAEATHQTWAMPNALARLAATLHESLRTKEVES